MIDVEPGDGTIRASRDSSIAVVIRSASPSQIDLASLTLTIGGQELRVLRNRKGVLQYEVRDANGDGMSDLVVYFENTLSGLSSGTYDAVLKGYRIGGTGPSLFTSHDSVQIDSSTKGGGPKAKTTGSSNALDAFFGGLEKDDELKQMV